MCFKRTALKIGNFEMHFCCLLFEELSRDRFVESFWQKSPSLTQRTAGRCLQQHQCLCFLGLSTMKSQRGEHFLQVSLAFAAVFDAYFPALLLPLGTRRPILHWTLGISKAQRCFLNKWRVMSFVDLITALLNASLSCKAL